MMAALANTVKHSTTTMAAAAVISPRPSRAAATAARSALAARDRSRSPSSSLSPLPPSPMADLYDPAADAVGSPGEVVAGDAVKVEDEEVVEPPAKKKRARKPKEPIAYTIPDVERLTTTFKCVLALPNPSTPPHLSRCAHPYYLPRQPRHSHW